jgi:hypothetical protein
MEVISFGLILLRYIFLSVAVTAVHEHSHEIHQDEKTLMNAYFISN